MKWSSKPLKDLIFKTETVNPMSNPESYFEYIDVSSVSNDLFKVVQTQSLIGRDAPSRARKLVKENDIIFATVRPTLKRIAIIPSELNNQICSTGYCVLRPKAELHYKYLFYFLLGDDFLEKMEQLQKGASYPAVTDGEVKAQYIPLPPFSEQKRIVELLDETFQGLDRATLNTQRKLDLLKESK